MAVVEVADRGRGIPEDDREEVFERLANASNDPYPGNGLGLPVAALLSTALDGELTLE
ncbi:ATP-binding protein, partial [Micrococcus endophyticus]